MSAAALEPVTFSLHTMGWSPATGHAPFGERVGWLRSELSRQGFGIDATVANCGVRLPPGLARKADNNEDIFRLECAAKGIEVITTDYEITFKKGGAA